MINRRTRLVSGSLVVVALACGGERQSAPPAVQVQGEPTPGDSIQMPSYPEARRGYLVARSAGAYDLNGQWPARAVVCEDPPVMEILSQQPGVGTIAVLRLPEQAQRLTSYPIAIVDSGTPVPPAAQMGVVLQGTSAYAFQGLEGQVQLTSISDRVSGRFQVTLREITSDDLAKYAGVFETVPLVQMSAEQCEEHRGEPLPPPDSAGVGE